MQPGVSRREHCTQRQPIAADSVWLLCANSIGASPSTGPAPLLFLVRNGTDNHEICDAVRNRVLNMALEIKSDVGETDADLKKITPQEAKQVDQT